MLSTYGAPGKAALYHFGAHKLVLYQASCDVHVVRAKQFRGVERLGEQRVGRQRHRCASQVFRSDVIAFSSSLTKLRQIKFKFKTIVR